MEILFLIFPRLAVVAVSPLCAAPAVKPTLTINRLHIFLLLIINYFVSRDYVRPGLSIPYLLVLALLMHWDIVTIRIYNYFWSTHNWIYGYISTNLFMSF